MTPKKKCVVSYENVDSDYLEKRKLQKSAGWILLWALGVGAVISGDYFGWNLGLAVGGFWGLAGATLLMAVMYLCMVFTIAELSAALPHAGGFFSFTRNAFGPTGGFICGMTDAIEYVITPAVIVVAISGYGNSLIYEAGEDIPVVVTLLWWVLAYGVFVTVNIRGAELTLKIGLVITAVAAAVLILFFVLALATGSFHWELLFNIEPPQPNTAGHSAEGLPFGWFGMFAALPYAIWFYLAIEQLPLAAEETHDVASDMPKALVAGIITLLALSLFTLVLNTGVGGGAKAIGASDAPLADGIRAVLGDGVWATVFKAAAMAGLIASFHTIIYAYGRVLFALSRAGYIPRWISLTGKNHTPYMALLLGAGIGFACAVLILFNRTEAGKPGAVGAALLNMAVFGAVISYAMVMLSYIQLRIRRPDLPRPYKSPLGIPGAAVGGLLSLVALVATFMNEDYRPGVIGVALFLFVSIIYFLLYSRHRLVAQAPEEEIALIAKAEEELSQQ